MVTEADIEVERFLRASIERRFPINTVVGEELGGSTDKSKYQWILDSIDGTESFIRGIPFFGTLIGITHLNQPVCGVADFPALDEFTTLPAIVELGL